MNVQLCVNSEINVISEWREIISDEFKSILLTINYSKSHSSLYILT